MQFEVVEDVLGSAEISDQSLRRRLRVIAQRWRGKNTGASSGLPIFEKIDHFDLDVGSQSLQECLPAIQRLPHGGAIARDIELKPNRRVSAKSPDHVSRLRSFGVATALRL